MENYIFPIRLEKEINFLSDNPDKIPSILCFHSIPAQGKTSFAKYLAEKVSVNVDYFDCNSHLGDRHGASHIMTTINERRTTMSLTIDDGKVFNRCFILDEFHNLSKQRQDGYKVTFDNILDYDGKFKTKNLVIICLNTDDRNTLRKKLTPAIYSRCHSIRFDILQSEKEEIINRAIDHYSDLDPEIIKRNVPDWRFIHRAIQMC